LGRAYFLLGRLDEARTLAVRGLRSASNQLGVAAHLQQLLGDIATNPDGFDGEVGEAHYREALALAEPRGMRPLVAHCHLGLAKLYPRTDKREQGQEHLATAMTMYREMGMTYWLEKAEAGAGAMDWWRSSSVVLPPRRGTRRSGAWWGDPSAVAFCATARQDIIEGHPAALSVCPVRMGRLVDTESVIGI